MLIVDDILLVIGDNDEARKTWQLSKDTLMISNACWIKLVKESAQSGQFSL